MYMNMLKQIMDEAAAREERMQKLAQLQMVQQQQEAANREERFQKQMAQKEQQMTQMIAFFQQQQQSHGGAEVPQQAPAAILTLPQLPDMEIFAADDSDPSKFSNWIRRFKFSLDCTNPDMVDIAKVKLLITKLSAKALAEYTKSCLPRDVLDFNLDQTVSSISRLFVHSRSLVVDRFECLHLIKEEEEEFRHFVNPLKGQLRLFKLSELKEEQSTASSYSLVSTHRVMPCFELALLDQSYKI